MKQILQSFKTGELWLAEVPAPMCRANGIVMRNRVSFVSAGTERMLVDFAKRSLVGKAFQMPDQVKKVIRKIKNEGFFETLEKVQAKLDQPIPLGYSSAGVVCEVDARVEGIGVGDRVACGGAGFANHAEYNFVPKNLVVKIPECVSFEDASCATVGSIAMQGIRQCDLRLGESVAIIGLGLLGMLALQMVKASGCRVIGFDPNSARCKLALELGADVAVSEGLEDAALVFSQGYGVDAVLITAATQSDEPVTVAAEICRMKGRVVATGLVGMNLPREQYYKKELDFKLSLSYGPGRYDPVYEEGGVDYPFGYVRWTEQRNMQAFVDLVAMGKISPGKLITHRFAFDNALEAYELLLGKAHEPYLGVVLEYADADMTEKALGQRVDFENKPKPVMSDSCSKHAAGVSFIGCGNFAKAVLLPTLKKQAGVMLRGLCTASGMSCGETAKKERFAFATTDQDEILKDKATDLVFVTTRHHQHAQQVCDCLKAGKNVFVEKPLALTRNQLDEVIEVVMSSAANVTVGFNRRFSPHAKLIKDYFSKRACPLMLRYHVNAGIIPKDVWVQDPEIGGGRMIGEGCHFIDFMAFVVGQPVVAVQAKCLQFSNAAIVAEDNVNVHLQFADGSLGVLSYVAIGDTSLPKEKCEVYGGESTVVMDNFKSTVCSGKLGERRLKGKQQKGFREELAAAIDMVRTGIPSIPFEQLVNVTRSTFAVLEALKSGGTVEV